MKTERYIVEIEMPEGDYYSSGAIKDDIKTSNYEEFVEGRWKFNVKPFMFPSEEEMGFECEKLLKSSAYNGDRWTEEAYQSGFEDGFNWLKSQLTKEE